MIKSVKFLDGYPTEIRGHEGEHSEPGEWLLKGRTFKFTPGLNVLFGPNMTGKSTILKTIAIHGLTRSAKVDYKKFRKAYKTIPPFYRGLGKEAAIEYFRRVTSKRSTAHWHLDYKGVRYWFWRIWEDPGITKFDSKERVTTMLPWWEKRGIARYNLWFYSFNKPKEATK